MTGISYVIETKPQALRENLNEASALNLNHCLIGSVADMVDEWVRSHSLS